MMKTSSSSATLLLFVFVVLISLPSPSVAILGKCNPDDKIALLKIKAAMNNPQILSTWDPNTDCCTWPNAVDCDATTGRVVAIGLMDENVTGQLSPAIGDLPYLRQIDINRIPNLTGPIPSTIIKLTHLAFLRLRSNKHYGQIPPLLGNLRNLTFIDLGSNLLTGSIPASLTKLTHLHGLLLNNNSLCGPIPRGGKLQKMDASSYENNKCLCGAPLPACKKLS